MPVKQGSYGILYLYILISKKKKKSTINPELCPKALEKKNSKPKPKVEEI